MLTIIIFNLNSPSLNIYCDKLVSIIIKDSINGRCVLFIENHFLQDENNAKREIIYFPKTLLCSLFSL